MSPAEQRVVLLILGFLVTDSALGDPCVTHTVLDQPWRSTDCSHTVCTGGQWMSDGNLTVGWYRFNSSGGWKIPETVVPQGCCSGETPGWLNGPHPSMGEGEVTRTVCFTWDNNTCYQSWEINVKNCSGYFVYRLGPTSWSNYAVFCTEPMSDTTQERQGSVTGEPGPGLTTSPTVSVNSGTDSQSDTTWEAQESMTGEPGLGLTTSPAGSLSSALEASTLEQSTGMSTGEHTLELSTVPAGDTSSDLETSTLEQSTVLSTREHTQELSSVPAGDTSSDSHSGTTWQTEGSATREPMQDLSSTPAGSSSSDADSQSGTDARTIYTTAGGVGAGLVILIVILSTTAVCRKHRRKAAAVSELSVVYSTVTPSINFVGVAQEPRGVGDSQPTQRDKIVYADINFQK